METPYHHCESIGVSLGTQGQLTMLSVVQSSRNSHSSKISCISSTPASLTRKDMTHSVISIDSIILNSMSTDSSAVKVLDS